MKNERNIMKSTENGYSKLGFVIPIALKWNRNMSNQESYQEKRNGDVSQRTCLDSGPFSQTRFPPNDRIDDHCIFLQDN